MRLPLNEMPGDRRADFVNRHAGRFGNHRRTLRRNGALPVNPLRRCASRDARDLGEPCGSTEGLSGSLDAVHLHVTQRIAMLPNLSSIAARFDAFHAIAMLSDRQKLAAAMRQAADGLNLGPSEIAAKLGVTRGAVSGWFKTGRVSKTHLVAYARLVGGSLAALVDPTPAVDPGDRPKLSVAAERLGVLFDYLDAAQRREVWPWLVQMLAPTDGVRRAFMVFPRDAPSAERFGDERNRAAYAVGRSPNNTSRR